MRYNKQFISFEEQLERLKSRGLEVKDDENAIDILKYNSYYRLRAYTYPFQDNEAPNHPFIQKISIEEIYELYRFDGRLRKLIFRALEKIEIALRTQIIYQFSKTYGSHWQLEPTIFRDIVRFSQHLVSLDREVKRSKETFIDHYNKKYSAPSLPPSWMSLEVSSFGTLSKIYQNLKNSDEKRAVADNFELNDFKTLENWMLCFSHLRNICAHHSRLWNKRLTALPSLPYNTKRPFLSKQEAKSIYKNKLYASLCCMLYILKIIDPNNSFKNDLINLMDTCPLKQEKEMGFPENWQEQTFWKDDNT